MLAIYSINLQERTWRVPSGRDDFVDSRSVNHFDIFFY